MGEGQTMSSVTRALVDDGRSVRGPSSNSTEPPCGSGTRRERSQPPSRGERSYSLTGTRGASLARYHAAERPVIPPPVQRSPRRPVILSACSCSRGEGRARAGEGKGGRGQEG